MRSGKLQEQTALVLERIALALHEPHDRIQLDELLVDARELRTLQRTASEAVTRGEESLQLNPRRSRNRDLLEQDTALLTRLNALVTRVIGMARAVRDHYDPAIVGDRTVQAIVTEMVRAAHDLRLIGRSPSAENAAEELPALTAPLVVTTPGEQWILIGSLLEDMRRVREEIMGAAG